MNITVPEGQSLCYVFHCTDALDLTLHVQKDASAYVAFYSVGNRHVVATVNVILEAEGAQAVVRGVYVLRESGSVQIQTRQAHHARNTRSSLICRGVLFDSSKAKYEGAIKILEGAIVSRASQENKNILLSQEAHAVSIPQLEVLTDDVQCAHGSAVGSIDPEHMFYLQSRGIEEEEARRLLLESFLLPAMTFDRYNNDTLEELQTMRQRILHALN